MTDWDDRIAAVTERELRTLLRSRTYALLAGGYAFLLLAVTVVSGASGYVPLVLTLLTPLELLVPILAAALGYRSILSDRESGELDVLRTYPVTQGEYVFGVYFGRLVAITAIVVVPLLLISVAVPIVGGAPTFLPQPSGLDSPILYLRFVTLTAVFSAVLLAIMTLISAVATSNRRGLVFAVLAVLTAGILIDVAAIAGLASGLSKNWSVVTLLGPTGAYRDLVMAQVVAPITSTEPGSIAVSTVSLLCWLTLSLLVATWNVWASTP